jgi:antitoxin MazE
VVPSGALSDYVVITYQATDRLMKTKIIRIGNSRGVRIPKPLLEQAGLEDEVQLRVVESGIVIEGTPTHRHEWGVAAAKLRERGEDGLLDEPIPTSFDESEWTWE